MLAALKTLGLSVEDDSVTKRATVVGSGGLFPAGKDSKDEVQLFLGNAGTAMRPLTAAVTAAGGKARSIQDDLCKKCISTAYFMLFLWLNFI